MANILVVEDEGALNDLICKNMILLGHTCTSAWDGEQALEMLENNTYDLMLLDVLLPKLDGFEVLRRFGGVPTIFLTAKDGLHDRVEGLSIGADDYLTKPFEMLELSARVAAVLRRTQKRPSVFVLGDVEVDFAGRCVRRSGEELWLTPKEFELLEILITNRNIALSRDRLLSLVWGYDFLGDTRTVDVHIQKLRGKLSWESCIKTVFKLGYRLEVKG